MFDIYLPILVLAPALIYFVPEGVSPTVAALASGSIFAATLVTRPIGALIFGRYADTIGRKKTTIIAVSGFGAMSVVMAALPGYQQWGVAAIIVFILAR
jgi:MFS family permease